MTNHGEIRLPIVYGKIAHEGYPSRLYGHLTKDEYLERTVAFNKLYTKHRHHSCLQCVPPHLFAIITMSIIVPLFILNQQANGHFQGAAKINMIWLVALMPCIAIISLVWMWLLSTSLKKKLQRNVKDRVATFNELDTPRNGIHWRFESHRTARDDYGDEFLVMELPNTILSAHMQQPINLLKRQDSDTTVVAFPTEFMTFPPPTAQLSHQEPRYNVDANTIKLGSLPTYTDTMQNNSPRYSRRNSTRESRASAPNRGGHRIDYSTMQVTKIV
ncbi:hypothetical protein G9A89_000712 [Geosiphon pyriformis]|nr:hypothetical protein G9A89_000712 [Geosiphon pyriformis]